MADNKNRDSGDSASSAESGQTKQWFVLYVTNRHEKKVAEYFGKQGLEFYLPLVKRKSKWSDRIKEIETPLLPGFIFTRLSWAEEHIKALQHPGALSFLREKGKPAVMPETEVENLRLLVAKAEDIDVNPDEHFPPGQSVRLRGGALKGVRGVVTRVKNKNRVFVRVPLLDQMVSTEVDLTDLDVVEE